MDLVEVERLADEQDVAGVVLDEQDLDRLAGRLGRHGVVSSFGNGQGEAEGGAVGPASSGAGTSQMRPPWNSTILLQIARPMPVPVYSSLGCRRWKITKIRSAYRGAMPMPLSLTVKV